MTIPRLSPYNVADDLDRSDLYREIRTGQTAENDWTPYEIKPDEELKPELIAFRAYQTADLKWLIMIATGLDDQRDRLSAGTVIKLPSVVWIRDRIKFYSGESA